MAFATSRRRVTSSSGSASSHPASRSSRASSSGIVVLTYGGGRVVPGRLGSEVFHERAAADARAHRPGRDLRRVLSASTGPTRCRPIRAPHTTLQESIARDLSHACLSVILMSLAQLPPSPDPMPMPIRGVVVDDSARPVAEADVWLAEAPARRGRRFGMELSWSTLTRPAEGTTPILVHAGPTPTGDSRSSSRRRPSRGGRRRRWSSGRRADRDGRPASPGTACPASSWPMTRRSGSSCGSPRTPRSWSSAPIGSRRPVPASLPRARRAPDPRAAGPVARRRGRRTGPRRHAGLAPAALGAVRVEAEGVRHADTRCRDSEIAKDSFITDDHVLAPVGRIAGRLRAPDGEPIRGVTVRATVAGRRPCRFGAGRLGGVACDEQGRFEIPAIAAGMLTLDLEFDAGEGTSPARRGARGDSSSRAGRTTEVTIPLRETLSVRGLVREKGTDRPIAGVKVVLNGHLGGDRFAITDAAGRSPAGSSATRPSRSAGRSGSPRRSTSRPT